MSGGNHREVQKTIERAARESYGRLLAYLSSLTRDVAGAEDALGEAFVSALTAWSQSGVPRNPAAWLLTAARNSVVNDVRRRRVRLASEPVLAHFQEGRAEPTLESDIPDERLKLLFVCAHPAIDPTVHTPLMLQTVLGIDAARISKLFLVSPKTMGQRLSRAKIKIRLGGIPFVVPEAEEYSQRLASVLEAVYGALASGWDEVEDSEWSGREIVEEAIWLARVLLHLMPEDAEVRGLLALMLYIEARRDARRSSKGEYVPLIEQDTTRWLQPLIEEAEQHLAEAAKQGRLGRFQLLAAIQSVHAERARSGQTKWAAIAQFYGQLVRLSPTLGSRTALAAAIAEVNGVEAGLAALDSIDTHLVAEYQPYWAVRGFLLQQIGRREPAACAYDRAIGLTTDSAIRDFLLRKRG